MDAAIFARCAGLQGKFWDAHDELFAASNLSEGTYASIAVDLKLNVNALATCRADASIRSAIQDDVDTSRNDGVNSTPFLFIGTKAHQGVMTADELKRQIDAFIAS
jgi:protein-disulfide isomerase